MKSEVSRAMLSAHIQPNIWKKKKKKHSWTPFYAQMDNNNNKAYFESNPSLFLLKQRRRMLCDGQVNHLTWIQLSCISLPEGKTKAKHPKNKQEVKTAASKVFIQGHWRRQTLNQRHYAFIEEWIMDKIINWHRKTRSLPSLERTGTESAPNGEVPHPY